MAISSLSAVLAAPLYLHELIDLLRHEAPDLTIPAVPGHGSGNPLLRKVAIDSREADGSSVFVAIKGENVDAHDFLVDLARKGIPLALVAQTWLESHREELRLCLDAGMVLLAFSRGERGLQAWASVYRRKLGNLITVGVTGSSGKTTVKDMLQSVLSTRYKTWSSPGNLNSILGLPLAVLATEPDTELAVFEMAMSEVGEMAILADMVRPAYAVITNIGLAHVANLGSQRAIAFEKKQIASCFTGSERLFIPAYDSYGDFLAEGIKGKVLRFGSSDPQADTAWRSDGAGGQYLAISGTEIHLPLAGAHIRADALAVVGIATELGIGADQIRQGFLSFQPGFGRGQIIRGRYTIVLDCYNANPDSMAAAIRASAEFGLGSRRVLVLGDMLELGGESAAAHGLLGQQALASGAQVLVFFGTEMAHAFASASAGNTASPMVEIRYCADFNELLTVVPGLLADGDQILLKASRGMALERLVPYIQETSHV